MKKITKLVLASILTLSLTSCSDVTVSKDAFNIDEVKGENDNNISVENPTYYLASEEDIQKLLERHNLDIKLKSKETDEDDKQIETEEIEFKTPKKVEKPKLETNEVKKPVSTNKDIHVNPKPSKPISNKTSITKPSTKPSTNTDNQNSNTTENNNENKPSTSTENDKNTGGNTSTGTSTKPSGNTNVPKDKVVETTKPSV